MEKCLPEFEHFSVFLKNKSIISKIRRSKVTDYVALKLENGILKEDGSNESDVFAC